MLACICFFFTFVVTQRLHATHNLMELLSAKHPGIPPTLRDDRLSEEVNHEHVSQAQRIYSQFAPFRIKRSHLLNLCSRVFAGGAAATALHDQVRLRGCRRPSESAAGAAEHQGAETQSEKCFVAKFTMLVC